MRAETKTGSGTPNSVKRLKIAIQNTKLIQFNSVQAYLHSISSQQQSSQDALCKDPTALGKTTTIKWLWQWEVKHYNRGFMLLWKEKLEHIETGHRVRV